MICDRCGTENLERAKFCSECAAPLVPESVATEVRKTVTIVFCDITGSTSLGESVDPESLRGLLASYFERMKAILESHGRRGDGGVRRSVAARGRRVACTASRRGDARRVAVARRAGPHRCQHGR